MQANVREQAMDVVVPLTEVLGVTSTFERIMVDPATYFFERNYALTQVSCV